MVNDEKYFTQTSIPSLLSLLIWSHKMGEEAHEISAVASIHHLRQS